MGRAEGVHLSHRTNCLWMIVLDMNTKNVLYIHTVRDAVSLVSTRHRQNPIRWLWVRQICSAFALFCIQKLCICVLIVELNYGAKILTIRFSFTFCVYCCHLKERRIGEILSRKLRKKEKKELGQPGYVRTMYISYISYSTTPITATPSFEQQRQHQHRQAWRVDVLTRILPM